MKNRSVAPDGKAVQRLRIEKGWRVEDLADKAKCSLKTVENVERGRNVYLYTLNKFAKALGVEPSTLMAGAVLPDPPKKERRFKVQFTLEIPFEKFDESMHLVSFLNMLRDYLQAKDEITVVGVHEGSTIITLEMSLDDIQRLIDVFLSRRREVEAGLDVFSVASLKLPDGEDFTLTETVENLEDGTVSEEPLRGRVYRRRLPPPAPKPPAATEQRRPQEDVGTYHGTIIEGLPKIVEPPVPEHELAHPDEDEDE
ncbi:MAG TPA: helix-turn-helix transcriptional regulator [Gemmataceae bacterium]